MKTTTIKVSFKVNVDHNKYWSEEELLQVAEDLVSDEWPRDYTYDGIENWYVTDKKAKSSKK